MERLEGNVALIKGASSGIALAPSALFLRRGATVAITGRDQEALDTAVHSLGDGVSVVGPDVGKPAGWTPAARQEGTKAAWTSSQPKRLRQGLPAEYSKLNKGETQKMLKRITTLILSTGMCLALAGPISLAFQDQSQSQDKKSGAKMESHDKMDSHDKMSKNKDKMSKDKMDKEEKMDKMDHQSY